MNVPALSFREVRVQYEPSVPPTIVNVTFSLAARERVALLGLNGSGKTTLLMSTVGLVPHEGAIFIGGERLTRQTVSRLRFQIGFLFNVPEDQLLFPKAIEDIAFALLRRGCPAPEATAKARQVSTALGIEELVELPIHRLSHGQKQRVALAGALITEPPLLLLDEPSAGLDPVGKRVLCALLTKLDAAMLIATHDMDFATRLCRRFLLLDKGQLRFDGESADEVNRRWGL
jgi:cobalt/nickel transport system ATP-binding protein